MMNLRPAAMITALAGVLACENGPIAPEFKESSSSHRSVVQEPVAPPLVDLEIAVRGATRPGQPFETL